MCTLKVDLLAYNLHLRNTQSETCQVELIVDVNSLSLRLITYGY